jgi:hypothetical protein
MNDQITAVTVSIPERAHLLQEAGESLRAQTIGPVPWLIRVEEPDKFGSAHVAKQRNAILPAVETPWIAVLDDDDLFFPQYLETMAGHLNGADVVYSFCTSTGHLQQEGVIDGECCIRTAALRAVGGYPVGDIAEDHLLFEKMRAAGAVFRCVPEVLRDHRKLAGMRRVIGD